MLPFILFLKEAKKQEGHLKLFGLQSSLRWHYIDSNCLSGQKSAAWPRICMRNSWKQRKSIKREIPKV